MSDNKYSVLMSVYHKEKPEYLEGAMQSILEQSVPTDDFVLVCDGPLNSELDEVIERIKKRYASVLHIIRLPENVGLGKALNEGMKYCKNELVARMDADDIARPDRCEKQLKIFFEYPDVAVCSGIIEEFSITPHMIEARRVLPEFHDEIVTFAKTRNPFNHPCVMYKKSVVEAVGSYQDFYLLEDYYLWVRLLVQGYKGYNIQEPLLWMRAGSEMYKRRAGWKYVKSQAELFEYMKDKGFISISQYMKSILIRSASSMAPNGLRKFLFKVVLRK